MTTPPPQRPEPGGLPGAAAFLGLGTAAAACVGAGLGLGLLADDRLRTSPLFLLVGLALGVVAAVAMVVGQVRRLL